MTRLRRLAATFGNGQFGRLGHATDSSELFPRIVSALASIDVAQVSCGGAHTAVLTDDGALYTFGINNNGQLGHSEDSKAVQEPTEVILPDRMQAVSAGESHTLALSTSGDVWACGSNDDMQLGLGRQAGIRNPDFRLVKELHGAKVVQVAAGMQHSLALTAAGEVFAWGHGGYGQLGLGPAHTRWEHHPVRVEALAGVKVRSIAAGALHSGSVDADANAYVWGHGTHWQLGLGHSTHECYPQQLRMLRLVRQLCLGHYHSMAIGNFGAAFTWGTDESGSLGQGMLWPKPGARMPVALRANSFKGGAAGWKHSAAVTEGGGLLTWGWGGAPGAGGLVSPNYDLGAGQLGNGEAGDQHEPRQVQRLLHGRNRYRDLRQSVGAGTGGWRALQVSCGRNHTAAAIEAALADWELD